MVEFYADIRLVHISAALTSGALFFARGLLLFGGVRWARAAPVRYLSYTIDTVLLAAALMLTTIVRQYPFAHGWLTMKVVLLVVYIGLGIYAFRPRPERAPRIVAWLAAVAVFLCIYSVARTHHPFGFIG